MTDTPFIPLLDRESALAEATKQELKLCLLKDLADYGSNLMKRGYENSDRGLANAVILFHMLREVVIQVDAIYVMLANGCGPATASVCRSLVEKYHLLLWTLNSQAVDKAEYLLVSACRNNLIRSRLAIPGTPENQELIRSLGCAPDEHELIQGSIHNANWCQQFLSLPRFSSISQMFEAYRAGGKKNPHEETWSIVFCKATQDQICTGSARAIAISLGKLDEYIVYYSDYSESTHGASALESFTFGGDQLQVSNIRGMNEFDSVWRLAVTSSIESFLAVIRHYCPEDEQTFCQKYTRDWLDRINA